MEALKVEPKGGMSQDEAKLVALNKNFLTIEFKPDGTVIEANENFLKGMGYELSEIQGQHHKMFCSPETVNDISYKAFWKKLAAGEAQIGQFSRVTKDGATVWLSASYTPITDEDGKVTSVIKFAQDITANKTQSLEYEGQINAISRVQAVIEFNLDGTIIKANDNFLGALGYSLDEIQGQHHRMFCEESYTKTQEYSNFWSRLGAGEFDSGEYKRLTKQGKEIWIQASYNPIFDAAGQVTKVIKFATDITEQKLKNADFEGQINAIDKSQAVIEFNLDGTIINANENFLVTLGYSMEEIRGKHHRMFCEPEYANTEEYKTFWQKLNAGNFDSGQYKRLGRNGKEIWIQASYNPILDVDGNVAKVVKYATDLTQEKEAYNNLVDSFEKASDALLNSAEELSASATQLNSNSKSTLEQSKTASTTTDEVSRGIQSVGVSTEEMTASIREIAGTAAQASQMSQSAKQTSEDANVKVQELGDASEEIGKVIKVISSIAQQTNLLALNATIEAARAGDAGKGFAVVANEVKELAKQTAGATEEISNKIINVQNSTEYAVKSIAEISQIIDKLDQIASSTATAVEEQAATTSEVSRVVEESATMANNISEVIQKVSASAEESTSGANKTLNLANELGEMSTNLKKLVEDSRNN